MKKFTSRFINNQKHNPLRIIALGGTTSVNKNLFVYEQGEDMVVIDCGIGLPDTQSFGIDIVVPNVSYLVENSHKLRAFIVSHAHEDHFGAIPYVLSQVKAPVYSSRLALEFIKNKLMQRNMISDVDLRVIDPSEGGIRMGSFTLNSFRVNHSVPDSLGFALDTSQGRIIHVSDFKFDFTPVMDSPFDIAKLAMLSDYKMSFDKDKKGEGVLCLLSDCLGATHQGFTESEKEIESTFEELMRKAKGQVFITTISSNISRMYQAIEVSRRLGRKVVMVGRSVETSINIAIELGYLKFNKSTFIDLKKARSLDQKKVTYIVAGSYGQINSALYKIAHNQHRFVKLQTGAVIIFSADPNPPNSVIPVNNLINTLTVAGADVIYSEIQEGLHVSGHGLAGDISLLASIVRPKYFIPIGGTPKYMRAYTGLMENAGFNKDNVFELLDGESIVFEDGKAVRGATEKSGDVYLDGTGERVIDEIVLGDRLTLADDGIVVAIIPMKRNKYIQGTVEIATRGFVYVKESQGLIKKAKNNVEKTLQKNKLFMGDRGRKSFDAGKLRKTIEKNLSRFLVNETGMRPLVLAMMVEI